MHNDSWSHKYFLMAHPIFSTEKKKHLQTTRAAAPWSKKLRVGIGYLLFSFSVLKVGVPVKKRHVSDYQQELPELKTGTPRRPHVRDQTGDFSPDSSPRRLIL